MILKSKPRTFLRQRSKVGTSLREQIRSMSPLTTTFFRLIRRMNCDKYETSCVVRNIAFTRQRFRGRCIQVSVCQYGGNLAAAIRCSQDHHHCGSGGIKRCRRFRPGLGYIPIPQLWALPVENTLKVHGNPGHHVEVQRQSFTSSVRFSMLVYTRKSPRI